jgi:hypothetical protein
MQAAWLGCLRRWLPCWVANSADDLSSCHRKDIPFNGDKAALTALTWGTIVIFLVVLHI